MDAGTTLKGLKSYRLSSKLASGTGSRSERSNDTYPSISPLVCSLGRFLRYHHSYAHLRVLCDRSGEQMSESTAPDADSDPGPVSPCRLPPWSDQLNSSIPMSIQDSAHLRIQSRRCVETGWSSGDVCRLSLRNRLLRRLWYFFALSVEEFHLRRWGKEGADPLTAHTVV